jgi:hypothetical protein
MVVLNYNLGTWETGTEGSRVRPAWATKQDSILEKERKVEMSKHQFFFLF